MSNWRTNTSEYSQEAYQDFELRKRAKLYREIEFDNIRHKHECAKKLIENSGLAPVLERCTFDNFVVREYWQEKAFRTAKAYADNPKGWLLLSGQSGSGKTHLCTAVAGQLLKAGHEVIYLLWRQDYTRISGFSEQAEQERNRARNAEVLYIDDLFKRQPTEQEARLAFDILDARYRTERPTIISTERLMDEIMDIDAAIYGRVRQMTELGGRALIKKDPARDWRRRPIDAEYI